MRGAELRVPAVQHPGLSQGLWGFQRGAVPAVGPLLWVPEHQTPLAPLWTCRWWAAPFLWKLKSVANMSKNYIGRGKTSSWEIMPPKPVRSCLEGPVSISVWVIQSMPCTWIVKKLWILFPNDSCWVDLPWDKREWFCTGAQPTLRAAEGPYDTKWHKKAKEVWC